MAAIGRGRVEVVARFAAADGKPVGEVVSRTLNMNLRQATYDSALQHGIACYHELRIPANAVRLKLLFANSASGKVGTLTIPLSEVGAGLLDGK
jgi:hypothetical protein